MPERRIIYRIHAVQRMFERAIRTGEIREVVDQGETIEAYPNDSPFPSRLMCGTVRGRVLHVVAADNPRNDETYVITVYEPDPDRWDSRFRVRR